MVSLNFVPGMQASLCLLKKIQSDWFTWAYERKVQKDEREKQSAEENMQLSSQFSIEGSLEMGWN